MNKYEDIVDQINTKYEEYHQIFTRCIDGTDVEVVEPSQLEGDSDNPTIVIPLTVKLNRAAIRDMQTIDDDAVFNSMWDKLAIHIFEKVTVAHNALLVGGSEGSTSSDDIGR